MLVKGATEYGVYNHIYVKVGMFIHPSNSGLTEPQLLLGHGWVITPIWSYGWIHLCGCYFVFSLLFAPKLEPFSALLALCAGNSPVTDEFPTQRPMTRSFDVFFDRCLNKRFSKQSWGWWFEMPSRPLWHHCNGLYCLSGLFHIINYPCVRYGLKIIQILRYFIILPWKTKHSKILAIFRRLLCKCLWYIGRH